MKKYLFPCETWDTTEIKQSKTLSDEFSLTVVQDDEGRHLIKTKDLEPYIKTKIDDWFFSNDSMGADLLLAHTDEWYDF